MIHEGDSPILRNLTAYTGSKQRSFHTPGHKNYDFNGDFFKAYPYDATEISFTDELYSPQGCIALAEEKATELFGSFHTFLSAGGASQCVKAALAEFGGKKVLFDRNIHFSAAAAISFYGIEGEFLYEEPLEPSGLPLPPTLETVEKALEDNPDCAAIFITTPNYFGISADCLSLRRLCDEKNVTFIADNSHGTHYAFCPQMKNSPYDGHHAHVVIDSAHKTLPVMTGGAFLHYNRPVSLEDVRFRMMAAGSTSPSFPILASLDYGRALCAARGEKIYGDCCVRTEALKKRIADRGFFLPRGEGCDPLRITLFAGEDCGSFFESKNIIPEMVCGGFAVFIVTPFNTEEDLEALEEAVGALEVPASFGDIRPLLRPERAMALRDAFFAPRESLPLGKCIGRVCGGILAFHRPPCIPILLPGEIISSEIGEVLKWEGYEEVSVCRENDDLRK